MTPPVLDWTALKQDILPLVNKPARYLGIERGAYRKDPQSVRVRMAMIFPDIYEIGVSNYGHKLLYSLVNNHPNYLCDRAYAPADDMRQILKERNIPLFGLETGMALAQFEVLAFSLQYELNYTTILGILDASHIAIRTQNRPDWSTPILIAGGPGSGNPMPLAPFFDAFIIGDGEEVLLELLAMMDEAKTKGWTKPQTREALATIEGVFVPGVNHGARKRIVDISQTQIELSPLVPYIQTVHDRVTIEARRGCDRMCRFCQPCFVNLPAREPSIDTIRESALKEIAKTGYEECSLLSLSIADYSQLKPLIEDVAGALREEGVSLSLPSQRADRFNVDIAEAVQSVRKSTLTFAPEAGTERLRGVINKNLSEAEIMNAVTSAFMAGWNKVKLYFILGLPTETDADLQGIADLVAKMQQACQAIAKDGSARRSRKNFLDVNVTLSNFVPKPHTPFQWSSQDTMAELRRKIAFLKDAFKGFKGVKLNFTDPEISKLEAVISRGDARMADVIERAFEKGAYLEAWDENLLFKEWFEALQDLGIDPDDYTQNAWTDLNAPLPWDGIDMGLERDWLVSEYQKSMEAASSEPCFTGCNTCGVCPSFGVQPVFMKPQDVAQSLSAEAPSAAHTDLFPIGQERARLTIAKKGDLRFISHLDWLRMLHRAIHRAGLPIAYTQGFNPTARVVFGPALPMFTQGLAELVDLELTTRVPDLVERLNVQLPPEGQILGCQWLPLHGPSIEKSLRAVIYSARWTCGNSETRYTCREKVDSLFAQPQWIASVKRKSGTETIDLKPFIHDFDWIDEDYFKFTITPSAQGAWIKPAWFLQLIDPHTTWDVTRDALVLGATQPALKV